MYISSVLGCGDRMVSIHFLSVFLSLSYFLLEKEVWRGPLRGHYLLRVEL